MLTRPPAQESALPPGRNLRRERKLWHDAKTNTASMGCAGCPEIGVCGGLRVSTALFDCLNFCCGTPESCDRVCRYHPDFAARVREVETFALETVARAPRLPTPTLPRVVPILYHGHRRTTPLEHDTVALSLYGMFDRRSGALRYGSHEAVCQEYRIQPGAQLILTGTTTDAPLERWWELGESGRRRVLRSLPGLGVVLATTPNYSVFTDQPRWGDLHSMKRIAIVQQEFASEGIPTALHINGRTDQDFRRWADYVASRPEITHLAYEFTTGTRWPGRREQHARWLAEVAAAAGRPLELVVRGGSEVLPELLGAFPQVTVLNATAFMKTMMRRRALCGPTASLQWLPSPTPNGATLDDLLADNVAAVTGVPRTSLVPTGQ